MVRSKKRMRLSERIVEDKELLGRMGNQPANSLTNRWFVGLKPSLWKKMKIVSPMLYISTNNHSMDLQSENKTSKKKNKLSDDDESSNESCCDEESNKNVQALQKDMRVMMEFEAIKRSTSKNDEGELWCTNCNEGYAKAKESAM